MVHPLTAALEEMGFSCRERVSKNYLEISWKRQTNRYYLFSGKDEASAALIQGMTLAGVMFDETALMPRSFAVFIRTYYNNLPEKIARRLTELNPVALAAIPGATAWDGSETARKNIASSVASDAAFAQAIRAANIYREKLGFELLGPDGNPEPREEGET